MKDLPENELLSAYLDGELTAAEQAEVEQLLGRSPAARQLLDEFRALSSKLQALPQYKLGEDLSGPVLQIAQRRMLTEPAGPAKAEKSPRPVPPRGRAILRRILNPRAAIWSGLAAAAVIIAIWIGSTRRQPPDGDGAIAKAPETVREPEPAQPMKPPGKTEGLKGKLANGERGGTAGRKGDGGGLAFPVPPGEYPAAVRDSGLTRTDNRAELTSNAATGQAKRTRGVREGRDLAVVQIAGEELSVPCDVLVQFKTSPEAHWKPVFDRALTDNKIAWDEPEADGKQPKTTPPHRRAGTKGPPADAVPTEKPNLVLVEASRAQVKGMLTALKAQPQAFSLVSFEPAAEGEALKDHARYFGARVLSKKPGEPGPSGGYRAAVPTVTDSAADLGQSQKAEDKVGPRAYARWIRFPAPGSASSIKLPEGDADLPMVRALFVLQVADLKSRAASVEARFQTAAEASRRRDTSAPRAAEKK